MRNTTCFLGKHGDSSAGTCPHGTDFDVTRLVINGGEKSCSRGNNCPHQTERTIQQFHAILIGEKSVIIAKAN